MATSPTASTPASAASPPSITTATTQRPSLCMKPTTIVASPTPNAGSPTGSLTTREWIVPPRPKPGRKPATDTPPTKRKAQNRAAQRAFRERRAARVGELEEQMKVVEEEHEQQYEALKMNVMRLEGEVEQYRAQIVDWANKCQRLEKELTDNKARHAQQMKSIAERQVVHSSQHETRLNEDTVGCGNCTMDTRCQCIDDAFNAMNGEAIDIDHEQYDRQRLSPDHVIGNKRMKLEPAEDMEIDFTAMYSKPGKKAPAGEAVPPTSGVADPCGFCQEGTPCICAEMAAEQDSRGPTSMTGNRQLAQFTPPPSEGDVVHAASARPGNCAAGPGTCAQCRADPNSTLFCKSLAASRTQSGTSVSGCCGGKGTSGGCCQESVSLPPRQTRSRAAADRTRLTPVQVPKSSVTLTCADAYTTLSRHPAYERASGDIANWMPKLHANPANSEGRPAMEIDAANVMAVLRDFDRRFGSNR